MGIPPDSTLHVHLLRCAHEGSRSRLPRSPVTSKILHVIKGTGDCGRLREMESRAVTGLLRSLRPRSEALSYTSCRESSPLGELGLRGGRVALRVRGGDLKKSTKFAPRTACATYSCSRSVRRLAAIPGVVDISDVFSAPSASL